MIQNFQDQAWVNATLIPGSAAAGPFRNKSQSINPLIVLVVTVANAPTGTSPTLTFAIGGSLDQVNYAQVGATIAITAAGTYRFAITDVLETWLDITPIVSAGGSFTGVTATLLSTSPDS